MRLRVLRVRRWLGVRGSDPSGSVRLSTVRGRQLTILSPSVMRVRSALSSSWVPWSSSSDDRTDLVVQILLSQTLSM